MLGRRLLLVVVLAAAGTWVVVAGGPRAAYWSVRYQEDEPGFRAYVRQYVGGYGSSDQPDLGADDRAWALAHPDELLAEGRAACGWLADQPRAPRVRTHTGPYSFPDVAGRYERLSTRLDAALSEPGRSTVVAGAWEYLCRDQRLQRIAPAPED